MSDRNYLSAREKNCNKFTDCLPNINQQKLGYRLGHELPPLSANTSKLVNRNLNYSYEINSFLDDCVDRTGTPFSDFFSDSGTSTPDFHSEESDSSSGSILRRTTAEATKQLADEWHRIERTLYDEDGEKCTRPQIVEECKQWKVLHPQFRVCGKAIPLPDKKLSRQIEHHDEIIAMHYSDYEQFSELDERLSQSSTDVTPENSPRPSIQDLYEQKVAKDTLTYQYDQDSLPDQFCSLLQITPIQIRSPSHKRKQSSSLLRSELASSKWMRNRPDSSLNCDRNSAKSFVSLDTRNYNALSASERNPFLNGRVVTAKHKEITRLEPIWTPPPQVSQQDFLKINGMQHYNIRKVSLPPLLLEEEKRKVASAKKHNFKGRRTVKAFHQLDRVRH